jgi:hypothetical protein
MGVCDMTNLCRDALPRRWEGDMGIELLRLLPSPRRPNQVALPQR